MIKPLDIDLIVKPSKFSGLPQFNKHHGTKLGNWDEYYHVIGFKNIQEISSPEEEEYEKYLKWVEILNSPLYKALQED